MIVELNFCTFTGTDNKTHAQVIYPLFYNALQITAN